MSDLLTAAATFGAEATAYRAIIPVGGPPCPDGGDTAVNQSLSAVVQLIAALHLQAAGVIEADSGKLRQAHDTYANTEDSLTELCRQIISPSKFR
jgi:hypothetical protein